MDRYLIEAEKEPDGEYKNKNPGVFFEFHSGLDFGTFFSYTTAITHDMPDSTPAHAGKKILFVITQGGPWGGAQRYVFDLATGLKDAFDITVAIGEPHGPPDLQKKLTAAGIEIKQLKHLVRSISPIHDLLAVAELRKLYQEVAPDIVHLNSSKAGIIGSFAARLRRQARSLKNIYLVYTAHGWVFNEPLPRLTAWLYRALETSTARWKDRIIVLSEEDKQVGTSIGIPEEKLIVTQLGIDTRESILSRLEARAALAKDCMVILRDNQYTLVTIANFYKTKGLDILFKELAAIKKDIPNLRAVIFGDGPERSALVALIKKNELESVVTLAGFVDNAAQYLPAFDLFVLPSRKEGLPYTILEAERAELPIVAAAVGGIPSHLRSNPKAIVAGIDVPWNDLGKLIVYAYQNRTVGVAREASAFRYTVEEMIRQTTSLYQVLLREGYHS